MITISKLKKTFAGVPPVPVLHDISLGIEPATIMTLLGPSGSGKSTLLRCVAGLENPDEGDITLGTDCVFSAQRRINLPPNKRNIGMVFQSYAIWPHMSVAGNVAYPLESRGRPRAEITQRVARALDQVGLAHLAGRDAPNLSGGQQQRVALARAIASEPDILLLDEPLSNLDAKLRAQMRSELADLQRRLGLTMLYVTHDQEEALALSHQVALMHDGHLVEVGRPADLFERPGHRFTADFLGLANFIRGTLTTARDAIDTPFGRFTGTLKPSDQPAAELFFRPHHAILNPPLGSENSGDGVVADATFLGEVVETLLRRGDDSIRLRLHPTQLPQQGATLRFAIPPAHATLFIPA